MCNTLTQQIISQYPAALWGYWRRDYEITVDMTEELSALTEYVAPLVTIHAQESYLFNGDGTGEYEYDDDSGLEMFSREEFMYRIVNGALNIIDSVRGDCCILHFSLSDNTLMFDYGETVEIYTKYKTAPREVALDQPHLSALLI